MNISGFNNAFEKAMNIENDTQGNQVNTLGNIYDSYGDDNEHLAQFNKGLGIMEKFKDNQIHY